MVFVRDKKWLLLFTMIVLHGLLWLSVLDIKSLWLNVPPVPSENGITAMMLGDKQLAYRSIGITLQNLGNTGGRVEPLRNYDYTRLKAWLFLAHRLDPRSDFAPYIAAYYFGVVGDPEKIRALVEYLHVAGQGATGHKWRWLGQAVYLARYQLKDMDLAYKLAQELAVHPDPTLPAWAKQMPAFIQTARGDKQAAYDIMVEILKSEARHMPVQEINFMKDYICTRLLTPTEAAQTPLCEGLE